MPYLTTILADVMLVVLAFAALFWVYALVRAAHFAWVCLKWLNRLLCFRGGRQQQNGWAVYELDYPDLILVAGYSHYGNSVAIRLSYYVNGSLVDELKLSISDRDSWSPWYRKNDRTAFNGWFGSILAGRLLNSARHMVANPTTDVLDPGKAPTISIQHQYAEAHLYKLT